MILAVLFSNEQSELASTPRPNEPPNISSPGSCRCEINVHLLLVTLTSKIINSVNNGKECSWCFLDSARSPLHLLW